MDETQKKSMTKIQYVVEHNLRAFVIGLQDKNYTVTGRAPVMTVQRNDLEPPETGWQWCVLYGGDLWVPRFLSSTSAGRPRGSSAQSSTFLVYDALSRAPLKRVHVRYTALAPDRFKAGRTRQLGPLRRPSSSGCDQRRSRRSQISGGPTFCCRRLPTRFFGASNVRHSADIA
jgi:hypothetical protein